MLKFPANRVFANLALLLLSSLARSQPVSVQTSEEQPAGALLRTYVNLVQVPVLVLHRDKQPMPPLDTSRFRVRLDSGPPFVPRHVRREGADPIRLLVLVEESGNSKDVLTAVPDALAQMGAGSLAPQDRVSITATFGCVASSSGAFAANPERLQRVATKVLRDATADRPAAPGDKNPCGRGARLWDSLASAVTKLKDDPGRRVLLVLTDGTDTSSRVTATQVQELAAADGVSIFGIRRDDQDQQGYTNFSFGGPTYRGVYRPESDPLVAVAETSGGMVFEGHQNSLSDELARAIALVRGRYIVDFARPSALAGGMHSIDVSIGNKAAFIRVGGTTVPLPDPAETNDPDRVPDDHANEPPVGTRRILKH